MSSVPCGMGKRFNTSTSYRSAYITIGRRSRCANGHQEYRRSWQSGWGRMVGNTEVMCESDAQIVSTKNRLGALLSAAKVPSYKRSHPWLPSLYTALCSLNAATD